MYRRRIRPRREVIFGFDSFLDVVANVIGIVVRLILVAWVGARAYDSTMKLPLEPVSANPGVVRIEDDPLFHELVKIRSDLDAAHALLAEQGQNLSALQSEEKKLNEHLQHVAATRQIIEGETQTLANLVEQEAGKSHEAVLSLKALQERSRSLAKEVEVFKHKPIKKTTLSYRVPVSRPVYVDELHFECRAGRAAFIDMAGFLSEIKRGLGSKAELLKSQWQITETTAAIGAFRVRYTVERERGPLDGLVTGGMPADANFRYGISAWIAEPVNPSRGETAQAALAPGSAFRIVADAADKHTVVTFWVYPDSFELFRRLRDYLYERGAEVAGRPLPEGVPIAASKHGTASRGQ